MTSAKGPTSPRFTRSQELREDQGYELAATLYVQFAVEASYVSVHRGWGYTEIASDRGLAKTIEDPLRNLRLTRRQSESVDKDAPFLVSEYLRASTAGRGRHADGARSRDESA